MTRVWKFAYFNFFNSLKILSIHFREREREQTQVERERRTSRPYAECGAQLGTQSHNPEIVIRAKIKSQTFNRLSHPGISHAF